MTIATVEHGTLVLPTSHWSTTQQIHSSFLLMIDNRQGPAVEALTVFVRILGGTQTRWWLHAARD